MKWKSMDERQLDEAIKREIEKELSLIKVPDVDEEWKKFLLRLEELESEEKKDRDGSPG